MTIVAPSLLACDFLNIEAELKAFDSVKDFWFHLDIMDGHFVPNLTFGHPIVEKISKKTSQPLDAHFMVTNPLFYIETFKNYGIHNFTFHVEAGASESEILDLLSKAKKYYPSVGLSLRPGTSLQTLTPKMLEEIDLLLVMSVEPGFGGQGFIESTWQRLEELKKLKSKYHFQIQVDGGVNGNNAQSLIQAGVDNLVAGSFIFKAGPAHYHQQIVKLRNY